jgi:hypothetical protein
MYLEIFHLIDLVHRNFVRMRAILKHQYDILLHLQSEQKAKPEKLTSSTLQQLFARFLFLRLASPL